MFLSFKVVRLCAKSREAVSSPVEHLTLHYQVYFSFSLILFFSCYDDLCECISLLMILTAWCMWWSFVGSTSWYIWQEWAPQITTVERWTRSGLHVFRLLNCGILELLSGWHSRFGWGWIGFILLDNLINSCFSAGKVQCHLILALLV